LKCLEKQTVYPPQNAVQSCNDFVIAPPEKKNQRLLFIRIEAEGECPGAEAIARAASGISNGA
jgi:hypothetical protein